MALIAGLGAALDYIAANANGNLVEGRKQLIANAEICAAMTREAAKALGIELFAPSAPAAAVTALIPRDGLDSGVIVKAFKEQFGAVISNGQGEMKGKLFRIAHLGYFDYLDTIALIGALELVMARVYPSSQVEFGNALRQAQIVFAGYAQTGLKATG